MGSNQKQTQIGQKEFYERKLKNRLASLSKEGIESKKTNRDPLVKKFRAKVEAINTRLGAIDVIEKKNEELARMKLEKANAPRKELEGTKEKKVKETPVEVKEKKKKKS